MPAAGAAVSSANRAKLKKRNKHRRKKSKERSFSGSDYNGEIESTDGSELRNKGLNEQQQQQQQQQQSPIESPIESLIESPIERKDEVDKGTSFQENLKELRYRAGIIVNNFHVQMSIIFLILLNSAFMGIATFSFVADNPAMEARFEAIDKTFLIIFTIELCFQITHHGWHIFFDGWLFFDFAVVMISWASDFMDGANLQVMRAFRIFRAFRLITRVKVMRALVSALIDTIPNMTAIVLLLTIVTYIFAVMFTSLYKDLENDEQFPGFPEEFVGYFRTLEDSFFTLFQVMTMDGWADICREIMLYQPLAWIPFVAFVILTAFVCLNLVIAVICDAVGNNHEEDLDDLGLSSHSSSADGSYFTRTDMLHEQVDNMETELDAMKMEQESIHNMLHSINAALMEKQIPIEVDEDDGGIEMSWGFQFKD